MQRTYYINAKVIIYRNAYFCITSLEDGNTITIGAPYFDNYKLNNSKDIGYFDVVNLYYSADLETWTKITDITNINLDSGKRLYFKGENNNNLLRVHNTINSYGVGLFSSSKTVNVGGYISTLFNGNTSTLNNKSIGEWESYPTSYCDSGSIFSSQLAYDTSYRCKLKIVDASNLIINLDNSKCLYLFYGIDTLLYPPKLPSVQLSHSCYKGMFADCTSLVTPPELPATTLASNCYEGMFSDCSNLRQPPKLPATQLNETCYQSMFSWCTSLESIPKLPALTLPNLCYGYMFLNCNQLKVSNTQTEECPYPYRIPCEGTGIDPSQPGTEPATYHMFKISFGNDWPDPAINTTIYLNVPSI